MLPHPDSNGSFSWCHPNTVCTFLQIWRSSFTSLHFSQTPANHCFFFRGLDPSFMALPMSSDIPAPAKLLSFLEVWEVWQSLAPKSPSLSLCSLNPSSGNCFLKLLLTWYLRVSFSSFKLPAESLLLFKKSLKFFCSNNWCHFSLLTRSWLLCWLKIKMIFFIWTFKRKSKKNVYIHT